MVLNDLQRTLLTTALRVSIRFCSYGQKLYRCVLSEETSAPLILRFALLPGTMATIRRLTEADKLWHMPTFHNMAAMLILTKMKDGHSILLLVIYVYCKLVHKTFKV